MTASGSGSEDVLDTIAEHVIVTSPSRSMTSSLSERVGMTACSHMYLAVTSQHTRVKVTGEVGVVHLAAVHSGLQELDEADGSSFICGVMGFFITTY